MITLPNVNLNLLKCEILSWRKDTTTGKLRITTQDKGDVNVQYEDSMQLNTDYLALGRMMRE